jgi:hypothetical protein
MSDTIAFYRKNGKKRISRKGQQYGDKSFSLSER